MSSPDTPVTLNKSDSYSLLYDWFAAWFDKQTNGKKCLDLIRAKSDELGSNAVNALCMFGLQHIITEADMNCWTYETEFKLYHKLPTVLVSTKFRSDNCICVSKTNVSVTATNASEDCLTCSKILQKQKGESYEMSGELPSVPVLSYEIISSVSSTPQASFGASLRKCALGCYETFRIARNFDDTVKEWSGFLFPSQRIPCPVVKVTVKPDGPYGVAYKANYEVLVLDDVGKEMKSSYNSQKLIMERVDSSLQSSSLSQFSYVLRLSREEVTECGRYFCSVIFPKNLQPTFQCFQITSAFAYVFWLSAEEKTFYLKCFTNPAHRHNLDNVERALRNAIFKKERTISYVPFCLSEEDYNIVLMGKYKFHCFKALLRPLDENEAKQCLKQFVNFVTKALNVLHHNYSYAHTDVRLENICFRYRRDNQPAAIFIDLDRCCNAHYVVSDEWLTTSVLYKSGFTNKQIDWRQLGCTVYWILKATSSTVQTLLSIHELEVDGEFMIRLPLLVYYSCTN